MTDNAKQKGSNTQAGKFNLADRLPDVKSHLIFWPVVIAGVAADLWTKTAVFEWLAKRPDHEYAVIDGIFTLVRRVNPGAAFSMASGRRGMLLTISFVALVAVIVYFLFGRIKSRLMQLGLALFTAGIIGNLYDRLFNDGYVRDFIDIHWKEVYHWPAFNVADSMLCIAVGLLIISNFTSASSQTPDPQQKPER
ncbi:Lipoprotein signal peptidase [Anaerohalosphaera lusitana]|uniref:Lipoprotein signal peptidase n=1 Tax=Anaerohalosphaera lusitana TaxID=1936003 RepID=A0A1U9NP87_9BACT|nr:signal peptidase II [Anaerohalosphaera lusitana]AQT69719.1 Lipoprotein signal peptidase [Anaerohalosphaera lusitana]